MPDRLFAQITPMVITFNEAPNIERCLSRLAWAQQILVIDSGSTDETLALVGKYRQANVVHRRFDSFAEQCNFGLSQVRTTWVLSLDADYELSEALVQEIANLDDQGFAGYRAAFVYRIHGHALRGSLYPPRSVLYRRENAVYRNEGHGHRVELTGKVGWLSAAIYHDDRKPLARWFGSQQKYASKEASHLLSSPADELGTADKLRLMGWPMPLIAFFYTLIWKGCLFDGWPGWLYVLQRVTAETMIALSIVDRRLTEMAQSTGPRPDAQVVHDSSPRSGETPRPD